MGGGVPRQVFGQVFPFKNDTETSFSSICELWLNIIAILCDVLSTYKFQAPVTSGIFIHTAFTRFYIFVLDCEMHFFFIFSEKKNCSNTDTWYSSKVTSLSLFVDMCHPLNVNIIFFVIKIIKHCFMILVAICRIWIRKLLAYYTMKSDLH